MENGVLTTEYTERLLERERETDLPIGTAKERKEGKLASNFLQGPRHH